MPSIKDILNELKDLRMPAKIFLIFGVALLTSFKVNMAFALFGIGLVFFAVCTEVWPDDQQPTGIVTSRLSVRLMWRHQIQFIGFYEAVKRGTQINLREGGSPVGVDPIAAVIDGIDDFGVCTCVDLIRSWHTQAAFRENGIVPCMVIFKRSPVCIIAAKEQRISMDELNGARIGFYGRSDSTFREFNVLSRAVGLRNIRPVFLEEERFLNPVEALTSAEINFRSGYSFNEGLVADFQQYWSMELLVAIFNTILYSDVLFTRLKLLQERPSEVEGIVGDIWEGFRFHLQPDREGDTWRVLREFCAPAYEQLSRIMEKTGHSPLGPVRERLRESFGRDKDVSFSMSEALGTSSIWEAMENLTIPDTQSEGSYVEFLRRNGYFK